MEAIRDYVTHCFAEGRDRSAASQKAVTGLLLRRRPFARMVVRSTAASLTTTSVARSGLLTATYPSISVAATKRRVTLVTSREGGKRTK